MSTGSSDLNVSSTAPSEQYGAAAELVSASAAEDEPEQIIPLSSESEREHVPLPAVPKQHVPLPAVPKQHVPLPAVPNKMVLAIPSSMELSKQLQAPSASIKDFLPDPRFFEDFKNIFAMGMDVDNEAVSAISVHMGQKLLEDMLCQRVIWFLSGRS
jgi:hypothetical protein